jgi:hypothetical protein
MSTGDTRVKLGRDHPIEREPSSNRMRQVPGIEGVRDSGPVARSMLNRFQMGRHVKGGVCLGALRDVRQGTERRCAPLLRR